MGFLSFVILFNGLMCFNGFWWVFYMFFSGSLVFWPFLVVF